MKYSIQFSFLPYIIIELHWNIKSIRNGEFHFTGFRSWWDIVGYPQCTASCWYWGPLPVWISRHFMTFWQEVILNNTYIMSEWESQVESTEIELIVLMISYSLLFPHCFGATLQKGTIFIKETTEAKGHHFPKSLTLFSASVSFYQKNMGQISFKRYHNMGNSCLELIV